MKKNCRTPKIGHLSRQPYLPPKRALIDSTKVIVADVCRIKVADFSKKGELKKKLRGNNRVSWARKLAEYLCVVYQFGNARYIADYFGHTRREAVTQAVNTAETLIEKSISCRREYEKCKELIEKHLMSAHKQY